jgi:DNA polymerase I-like protein with 3'-5' exonuclease and polymerase domains
MNVTNRKQFERVLYLLDTQAIKVTDSETDGLRPHHGNKLFSLSLYFPEVDESYNLSFRAGMPSKSANLTDEQRIAKMNALNWTSKERKELYLEYWYDKFRANVDFQNLPISWLDELKLHWGTGRWVLYNAKFDQHVFKRAGMPDMEYVEDGMLALHLVNEDFSKGRIEVEAPYQWTEKDSKPTYDKKDKKKLLEPAKCRKEDVGKWARGSDGELLKKKQGSNRRLKWFSAYLGLPNATKGEEGLHDAINEFEEALIDFIVAHPNDPTNAFALLKKGGISRAKVRSKIKISDKANMWMLPSGKSSYYAELDTILTWHLREWALKVIADWDNLRLYDELCRIQFKAIFPMEYHGAILDRKAAEKEIARLTPHIKELEGLLAHIAGKWGFKKFDPSDDIENVDLTEDEEDELFNVASPPQLLALLNKEGFLSHDFGLEIFPKWFPAEMKADLKTYEGVTLEKTNKEAFDEVEGHAVIRLIRFYRLMKKSADTYLKRWLNAADENDAIHSSFNVDGTVSGRMSSNGDGGNWQNIPTRGYYRIAEAIIAPKGYKIAALDYRTLEMGIAAAIAEGMLGLDPNKPLLLELRKPNADVHTKTVELIGIREIMYPNMSDDDILIKKGYNLEHEDFNTAKKRAKKVAKEIRQIAKTLNFGLLYAGTAKMVSRLLKIDRELAEILVQRWRAVYPAYAKAQEHYTKESLKRRPTPTGRGTGMYSTQPFSGRHRKLHKYSDWMYFTKYGRRQGFNPKEAASRKVWNNIVQGLGGYFCTMALLRYYEKYGYGHLIAFAQIHDALEVYVKEGSEQHLLYLAECMVDFAIDPGLRVDIAVSTSGNWQDMVSLGSADDYTYGRGEEWNNANFNKAFENWCLTEGRK